jgi:predicted nuclease with TOPRIM domain
LLWKLRQKDKTHKTQLIAKRVELQEKDSELQEKETTLQGQIEQLKKEKDALEAKYLKKVTAADVKKKNLARYRRKMKSLRKNTIAEEVEEIVGKAPSWLTQSREGLILMRWESRKEVRVMEENVQKRSTKKRSSTPTCVIIAAPI